MLTHGVGPMRRYVLGALLLDRDDPTRPAGYLPDVLLAPQEDERDGYVPNVVYSCGGLVHAGLLVVPYGFSDRGTAVATSPWTMCSTGSSTLGVRGSTRPEWRPQSRAVVEGATAPHSTSR